MTQINRKTFLKQAASGVAGLSLSSTLGFNILSGGQKKPNIILFISEDHALRDSGCYGNNVIRTPNIDRLAAGGMRFDDAYSIAPTSVPSYASIFTGLGPHRHGAHTSRSSIDKRIKTLPQYLPELGYRTILAGRTDLKPMDAFPFERIDVERDGNSLIVDGESEVATFLASPEAKQQPFCLVIAANNPQVPWPRKSDYDPDAVQLHPYHLDTPDTRKAMANYYQDVTNMDRGLGHTLDLLDEYNLAENTAFIFTSDHGPQFPHGKWELYDYGIHVPMIMRWPGRIEAATNNRAMMSSIDILPTIIEMAGGFAPENMDGKSVLDIAEGRSTTHRSIIYATHTRDHNMNYYPIRALRNRQFKYVWNLAPERAFTNNITNSNQFKTKGGEDLWNSWLELSKTDEPARRRIGKYQLRPPEELYNLNRDPDELNNVGYQADYLNLRDRYQEIMKEWMESQGDNWLRTSTRV